LSRIFSAVQPLNAVRRAATVATAKPVTDSSGAGPKVVEAGTKFLTTSTRPSIMSALLQHQSSFHHLVMRDAASHRADRVAFKCAVTGATLKYGEIVGRARLYAALFYYKCNVRAGSTVLLISPNTPNYICLFHGILALRAVVSPLNTLATTQEIIRQAQLANSTVLVASHLLRDQLEKSRSALTEAGISVCYDDVDLGSTPPVPEVAWAPEVSDPDETIVLPFSSGTTGLPKGVMLTNTNLIANLLQTAVALPMNSRDVLLSVLPFFHIYGLTVMLHTMLHCGGTQITFPRFHMETYLEQLQREKATLLIVAPPLIVQFAKHPALKQMDTSSVRLVLSGAAPLGEEVQRLCEPVFPHASVGQGYGLTETSPVVSITPFDDRYYGTAGQLVSDTQARIVVHDATADVYRDVPIGEEGELWVRGPQVMKGYLRQEDTDLMLPPSVPGRWLRTGDLGRFDSDLSLTITDRLKELIKYRGSQVAPAELEAVLQEHPEVAEALVVGVPLDDGSGCEAPRAHVVLRKGVDATAAKESELAAFVASKVSPKKKLRGGIRFVDAIPKTASGKLLRRIVRDAERTAPVRTTPAKAPGRQ
jgi:acyl-CoA synthetase (AMP-forming)/AMP-acid ligase II